MATSVDVQKLKAFGTVLRECRKNARLSQEELVDAAGPNRKFLSSLENGRQEPGLGTILKLARALGVRASEMLERTEEIALPASVLERIDRDTAAKIPLGFETCPTCKTVYSLYARRLKTRESRKRTSKCQQCKEPLASWSGSTELIYETKRMSKWRGSR